MIKLIVKVISVFIIFLTSPYVLAAPVGILDCDGSFNETFKAANIDSVLIPKANLSSLSIKSVQVLVIPCYDKLTSNDYNSLKEYVNSKGKLVLITPAKDSNPEFFKKLASIIGVNVEGIETTAQKKEINWVEKTLSDNQLEKNTTVAKISLTGNTTALAVFDETEKNECAISFNPDGVFISWRWGKDADKNFNAKSMEYIFEYILPKTQIIKSVVYTKSDFKNDLKKLQEAREVADNYSNNISCYSGDLCNAQEQAQRSKINEILAQDAYEKGSYDLCKTYLYNANANILNTICYAKPLKAAQHRGIWLDRGSIVNIKNQAQMGQVFEKLKQAGINTVYIETYNAGYSIFPSKMAAQNPLTINSDPLKWAVEEAHKRNIKLHAWIWVFAVGNDRHNPIINKPKDFEGPVLSNYPDWALIGEYGNLRPKNQPEFWIDPSNKEGVNFLLNLGKEIVAKYQVDGIQLDYIRYPFQNSSNLMGLNSNSVEQFENITGEKLLNTNYETSILWMQWKEKNIDNFVQRFNYETKKINPNLKISCAVFGKSQQERRETVGQNWELWAKNDWVDIINPMTYSMNVQSLAKNLECFTNEVSSKCLIYPGIALKHVDEIEMLKQLNYIEQEKGMLGSTIFAYAQLDEKKANFLQYGIFSDNAANPSYNQPKCAYSMLNTFKDNLTLYSNIAYDMSAKERKDFDTIIAQVNSTLVDIQNLQYQRALKKVNIIEKDTSAFTSVYMKYDFNRPKELLSLVKQTKILLSIAAKK
ncbi:MAG: family 10 glycosylhydrolase [Candidatus Gastranaerophilales bacterium]|nr:family 10 glycosylhydrolase [Candidatus Gastranaerophilales bacterium]